MKRAGDINRSRGAVQLEAKLRAIYKQQVRIASEIVQTTPHEMWGNNINRLTSTGSVRNTLETAIKSTAQRGFNSTAKAAGIKGAVPVAEINKRVDMAVQRITATTNKQIFKAIADANAEGLDAKGIAKRVKELLPTFNARAKVAAVTEIGNAWDTGSTEAFKLGGVTHIDVVGCQQREPNWTWHGKPTCNIKNVPLQAVHELVFHPNHTGTIVPRPPRKRTSATVTKKTTKA